MTRLFRAGAQKDAKKHLLICRWRIGRQQQCINFSISGAQFSCSRKTLFDQAKTARLAASSKLNSILHIQLSCAHKHLLVCVMRALKICLPMNAFDIRFPCQPNLITVFQLKFSKLGRTFRNFRVCRLQHTHQKRITISKANTAAFTLIRGKRAAAFESQKRRAQTPLKI